MAQRLRANYQPGEAREGRERRTEKMERARKMEYNLSANIKEREERDGDEVEEGDTDRKMEQKVSAK